MTLAIILLPSLYAPPGRGERGDGSNDVFDGRYRRPQIDNKCRGTGEKARPDDFFGPIAAASVA
jgi:hypothetical protein